MSFTDFYVDRVNRFAIGKINEVEKYYLTIPVRNTMIDYDEYYEIDQKTFEEFLNSPEKALPFVDQCRKREMDNLLILKLGSDRGDPI